MNKPKLDYNNVSEAILQKCNQLLLNVDVNTVSDAFDAVSEIVEIAIENIHLTLATIGRWKIQMLTSSVKSGLRISTRDMKSW